MLYIQKNCEFVIQQGKHKGKRCCDVFRKCKNKSHHKYKRLLYSIEFAKKHRNIFLKYDGMFHRLWENDDPILRDVSDELAVAVEK